MYLSSWSDFESVWTKENLNEKFPYFKFKNSDITNHTKVITEDISLTIFLPYNRSKISKNKFLILARIKKLFIFVSEFFREIYSLVHNIVNLCLQGIIPCPIDFFSKGIEIIIWYKFLRGNNKIRI